jgi:hypothetical protein
MLNTVRFMGLAPAALSFDDARVCPLTPTVPRKETSEFVPKPWDDVQQMFSAHQIPGIRR